MIRSLVRSMRPRQWVKNLVVFAGLVFDKKLADPAAIGWAVLAFGLFCLTSGGIYIINDIRDLKGDRLHPTKAKRPLASGEVSVRAALRFALALLVISFGVAIAVSLWGAGGRRDWFAASLICYGLVSVAYSMSLKDIVIIDVMVLASGFVLRAVAGAWIIDSEPSQWLLICSFLLALFLGFGKRRHELVLLEDAHQHRPILKEYSPYFLDQMMAVVTTATLVAYTAYTLDPRTVAVVGTDKLIYTIPFVLYGIFRYLYLVHQKEQGGNPTRVLLTDRPIMAAVLLWAATVVTLLYLSRVG